MRVRIGAIVVILIGCGSVHAQQNPGPLERDVSPGFKLRAVGDIDIGPAFAEVNYYSDHWVISQQHDRFTPDRFPSPSTQPNAHTIAGVLSTANGPARYVETVDAVDGGIDLSATFTSDKPLKTNELSETFILPKSAFGGKTISVDSAPVTLGNTTPTKENARLSEKDDAHIVVVPMPDGLLTITGTFHFLIQDDQAWGDPRYSMRLYYTPGSGALTHSAIQLQMRLKPKQ